MSEAVAAKTSVGSDLASICRYLREQVPVMEVLSSFGVRPERRSGNYYEFLCPFHEERNPSFKIKAGDTGAYCFGCGRSYSSLDVFMHFSGISSLSEAVREMIRRYGIAIPEDVETRLRRRTVEDLAWRLARELVSYAQSHYDRIMEAFHREKGYVLSAQDLLRFKMGFLPLEEVHRVAGKVGLTEKKLRALTGRLLIPVVYEGRVYGFWGRVLFPEEAAKPDVKNLYIRFSEKVLPVFLDRYNPERKAPVWVCEGPWDALALCLKGEQAIAVGGIPSKVRRDMFPRRPPDTVVLVPDPDPAGQGGVLKRAEELIAEWGRENVYVCDLPEGKDVDEVLLRDKVKVSDMRVLRFDEYVKTIREAKCSPEARVRDLHVKEAAERAEDAVLADLPLEEVLEEANRLTGRERLDYLRRVAQAKGYRKVDELVAVLREVAQDLALDDPKETFFIHPAIDYQAGRAFLGFRVEKLFLGHKEVFNVYLQGERGRITRVKPEWREEGPNGRERVFVFNTPLHELPSLEEKWGLDEVRALLRGERVPPSPRVVFRELLDCLKKYVYLEREEYYHLIVGYVFLTYFHRVFPAIPFLFLYGNKECGKSHAAKFLMRVCFNAQFHNRISEAALGDFADGFRGTIIVDQAEFLGYKGYEALANFLAGSYTQDTARRSILSVERSRRKLQSFDLYGPKVFAATSQLHFDLRDRCIIIPFVKTDRFYPDPTATSEDWRSLRGSLYALYLTDAAEMEEIYRQVPERPGRAGEIFRAMEAIFTYVGFTEDEVGSIYELFQKDLRETMPIVYGRDQAVLEAVLVVIEEEWPGVAPEDPVEVRLTAVHERVARFWEGGLPKSAIGEVLHRNRAVYRSKKVRGDTIYVTSRLLVEKRLNMLLGLKEEAAEGEDLSRTESTEDFSEEAMFSVKDPERNTEEAVPMRSLWEDL
ncbi:CHC2 zinc finger domain-containing protein [Thermosulfurimonas sp. F29]|uniref:CHC2 zinc finger domain-containing protein n=1 Tax=Thermosulfurimonas sp. F29 TaxID=2867247 RepID=UPI001C832811|nr:CHC2 zinc finger domain-containing protein [Thermosulfurimonas sp. F29]MBX6424208.1 toprim domain-containing protein [Thermosulfurimonas sp. F29]